MSLIQDHYEINVSLNGKHFFATDERSCVTEHDMKKVLAELQKRMPESDGFVITVTKITCRGRQIEV